MKLVKILSVALLLGFFACFAAQSVAGDDPCNPCNPCPAEPVPVEVVEVDPCSVPREDPNAPKVVLFKSYVKLNWDLTYISEPFEGNLRVRIGSDFWAVEKGCKITCTVYDEDDGKNYYAYVDIFPEENTVESTAEKQNGKASFTYRIPANSAWGKSIIDGTYNQAWVYIQIETPDGKVSFSDEGWAKMGLTP